MKQQMSIVCNGQQEGWASTFGMPSLQPVLVPSWRDLCLTDSEHLGSAYRAHALSRRLAILHGYGFGVLHFLLGAAFDAVRLHQAHLLLNIEQ